MINKIQTICLYMADKTVIVDADSSAEAHYRSLGFDSKKTKPKRITKKNSVSGGEKSQDKEGDNDE